MDGMPASVSAAILTTATNLLVDEVYSVRNTAAATPMGTAMMSAIPAMMSVLKNAGMSERFSLSYSSSKRDALRLGAPCMMTWMTIHSTIAAVMSADRMTSTSMTSEKGCRLYSASFLRRLGLLTNGLPFRSQEGGGVNFCLMTAAALLISPSPSRGSPR